MKKRILVIDDESSIREILKRYFELKGYEVITAEDGEAGLKVSKDACPDLVITDILMPRKNGFEVAEEIKKGSPGLKIIAISGSKYTEKGTHEVPDGLEADMLFSKPLDLQELENAVKSFIRDNQG